MRRAAVPLLLFASLLPALAVPVPEVQHFPPASAVVSALADVLAYPGGHHAQVRYLSAYNADEKDLPTLDVLASYGLNSLSFGHPKAPVLVEGTGGRLWRVVLSDYDISPRTWDTLGRKGSGRAPFPDPYFHLTDDVEEDEYGWAYYGEWQDSYGARVDRATVQANPSAYRWVRQDRKWEKIGAHTLRKTLQAPWLPEDDLVRLIAETDSYFPILRLDWFLYYSLLEPRYHELRSGSPGVSRSRCRPGERGRAQQSGFGADAYPGSARPRLLVAQPGLQRLHRGRRYSCRRAQRRAGTRDYLLPASKWTPGVLPERRTGEETRQGWVRFCQRPPQSFSLGGSGNPQLLLLPCSGYYPYSRQRARGREWAAGPGHCQEGHALQAGSADR
jgi:hypothetical protein